jgi:cyclopropane fatty-acyl-phospholipid synthase-like methyltransferase
VRFALALVLLAACKAPCPPAAAPPEEAPEHRGDTPHPGQTEHGGHHHHGHEGGPLVRRFDEGGEYWRKQFEGADRDAYQQPAKVIAAMKIAPGMTVADLGTGTGYFLGHLSPAVGPEGRVLALDIEPTLVRYVMERAKKEGWKNVEPHLVLPDDPLLMTACCDRILVVNVWHHIGGRGDYSQKLRRALGPGGEVWVIDFKLDSERGPAREHKVEPDAVRKELEAAGLSTRFDDQLLEDQYVVVGAASS